MKKNESNPVPQHIVVRGGQSMPGYRFTKLPKLLGSVACVLFATGCVTNPNTGQSSLKETFASEDPCSNNARNIGILAGAVAGAFIGNQVKHSNTSRIVGATVGGVVGGMVGSEMDKRRCELYKLAKRNNLEMRFEEIKVTQSAPALAAPSGAVAQATPQTVGMKVLLKDNGRQFESGTDKLNPEALAFFQQIADQYSYEVQRRRLAPNATKEDHDLVESLRDKRILLVGHTDDIGNSRINADLSERRAQAVARIFRDRGIGDDHIFYQGAGETLPIADNRSEDGRARNRRVEIVDLTDDKALSAYLASRKPVVSYYRTTSAGAAESSGAAASPEQQPVAVKPVAKVARSSNVGGGSGDAIPTSVKVAASKTEVERQPQPSRPTSLNSAPVTATTIGRDGDSKKGGGQSGGRGIDFGGEPVSAKIPAVDIGKLPSSSGAFSLISAAQADEPLAASCTQDRPRVSHGVKSLRDNQEISTRDYLPGLYDSAWAGTVNGHLVALTHVAVLRDGGVPARRPQLLLYPEYQGDSSAKPAFTSAPEVNSYQGEKGLLYRVFVSGPVQCLDIVIPNGKPTEAAGSRLFYNRGRELYMAAFSPKLAK